MRKLPKSIDDTGQILIWSTDEFVPVMALFGVGLVFQQLIICMIAAWIVLKVYRRFRDGRPDGFLLHMAYWWGLASPNTRTLPNAFIRRFTV